MQVRLIQKFLQLEAASGIILFLMAFIALFWANSPLDFIYQSFTDKFMFWINEGLMALFFLIVGLELKSSFLTGQLSRPSQVLLPAVGALGGMLIPALIYVFFNYQNPVTIYGWATPVATDIAFALGVLTLFGTRIPPALKLFLLMLAIFDDLGAIIIIAVFYSEGLHYLWLFQSAALVTVLYLFNKLSVRSLTPYLLLGVWLWYCLFKAGVHPTIAGVLLALTLPNGSKDSPMQRLQDNLHPWVAYVVMPLFALANAGFSLHTLSVNNLLDEVVLGISVGLFIGKPIGVFGFSWLLMKTGWARLPEKTSMTAFFGVTLLCGIGFTMSLFLGTLSFTNDTTYLAEVRLGVLIGSVLSALAGSCVLLVALCQKKEQRC